MCAVLKQLLSSGDPVSLQALPSRTRELEGTSGIPGPGAPSGCPHRPTGRKAAWGLRGLSRDPTQGSSSSIHKHGEHRVPCRDLGPLGAATKCSDTTGAQPAWGCGTEGCVGHQRNQTGNRRPARHLPPPPPQRQSLTGGDIARCQKPTTGITPK